MVHLSIIIQVVLFSQSVSLIKSNVSNIQRTGIFIRAPTSPGQTIFIRGGISSHVRPGCTDDATTDPCAIAISHRVVPVDPGSSYGQWAIGDNYLDWYGREDDQGDYNDTRRALGTPLMWTTSEFSAGDPTIENDGYGYTPLNRFGDHYWFVDLDMDCSFTEDGWFEFKVYSLLGGWETHIDQYNLCGGQPFIEKIYTSINHMGICGKLNVFFETENECSIYEMPENPENPPLESCGQRKMFEDGSTEEYKAPYSLPSEHIVNGYAASMGKWPWQGVLQYDDTIGGCAAVLIDKKWALAASHCVYNTWPGMLKVRIGEQNLAVTQGHEQPIQVQRIHIHDCYQSSLCGDIPYNDYDLAILELATEVDLSKYVANTACLPYGYGLDDFVGDNCFATGFGDTKGTGDQYRLYEINVPVYPHEECVDIWGADRITERQMCMGTDDKSACGGDSGGPLVCWKDNAWMVAGVTSWGTSDCQGQPSVYSRVTSFMDWIIEITGLTYCNQIKGK